MSPGAALKFGAPSKGWPTFLHDPLYAPEMEKAEATYISGPMRGYEACNFPAFDEAEEALALQRPSLYVYSPASHDRGMGYDFSKATECSSHELEAAGFKLDGAILWDLEVIVRKITDFHLLPGWQDSSGARLELEAARFSRRRIWWPTVDYAVGGKPEWVETPA